MKCSKSPAGITIFVCTTIFGFLSVLTGSVFLQLVITSLMRPLCSIRESYLKHNKENIPPTLHFHRHLFLSFVRVTRSEGAAGERSGNRGSNSVEGPFR
jgi:hypothetical protein